MEILVSQDEAIRIIQERVELGRSIRDLPNVLPHPIASDWCKKNADTIVQVFKTREVYQQYLAESAGWMFRVPARTDEPYESVRGQVHNIVCFLESLLHRLETETLRPPKSREVFLVHGRNEGAEAQVANLLRQLDLSPVILHERIGVGRTIIEEFERHSNVDFAVVVMTPDDVGGLADEPGNLSPRPRQNVVLELGFFMGKLGRNRVCALRKGNIENPSDVDSIVYISMDAADWRHKLGRMMDDANMDVDVALIR